MQKEEKELEYVSILDSLQRVKNGIVQDCQDELAMTGIMPESAQQELKVLAGITGNVFWGFKTLGAELFCDPKKPNVVYANIGGRTFSCGRASLPAEAKDVGLEPGNIPVTNPTPTPAVSVAPTAPIVETVAPVVTPAPTPVVVPTPIVETPTPVADVVPVVTEPTPTAVETPIEPAPIPNNTGYVPLFDLDEDDADAPAPVSEAKPVEPQPVTEHIETSFVPEFDDEFDEKEDELTTEPTAHIPVPETVPEPAPKADEYVPMFDDEPEVVSQPVVAPTVPETIPSETENLVKTPSGAVVFTPPVNNEPSHISSFGNMGDIFIEEQSKNGNEFVYQYFKITVAHKDFGSRPEEMQVLIAPLKISKYSCASVPIVVTILHKGIPTTVSSYDSKENGKNIVTIDVNEFYFLARGSFDDNGHFNATFVTTGISANQGDIVNVTYSKTYGNSTDRATRNGHIKFGYEAESGPGTIEVLPFGDLGDNDFVAIVKNDEFVDYYVLSKALRVTHRPIIYDKNGNPTELVCQWNGDILTAELV